jgi:hypothetical protein
VVSRRALLCAAAVLPLAGCTSEPEPPPPPDPDDILRDEAAARERALLEEYDAVLLVLPTLAPRLMPLRAEHVAHLAALTGPEPSGAEPSGAASAATSPVASATAVPAVPPPATAAAALAGLMAAEREASAAHSEAALAASRELAGLLASLSASEQSHPVALA